MRLFDARHDRGTFSVTSQSPRSGVTTRANRSHAVRSTVPLFAEVDHHLPRQPTRRCESLDQPNSARELPGDDRIDPVSASTEVGGGAKHHGIADADLPTSDAAARAGRACDEQEEREEHERADRAGAGWKA